MTSVAAFAATRTTSVMRFMAGRPVAVSSSVGLQCTCSLHDFTELTAGTMYMYMYMHEHFR